MGWFQRMLWETMRDCHCKKTLKKQCYLCMYVCIYIYIIIIIIIIICLCIYIYIVWFDDELLGFVEFSHWLSFGFPIGITVAIAQI